jgi:hypothetical protein
VLLVNAIFDGLNLVSKEAPLLNERDGVLILSENAGAHEELGEWAVSVNPFDVAARQRRFMRRCRCRWPSGATESSDPRPGARARRRQLGRGAAGRPRPLRWKRSPEGLG